MRSNDQIQKITEAGSHVLHLSETIRKLVSNRDALQKQIAGMIEELYAAELKLDQLLEEDDPDLGDLEATYNAEVLAEQLEGAAEAARDARWVTTIDDDDIPF